MAEEFPLSQKLRQEEGLSLCSPIQNVCGPDIDDRPGYRSWQYRDSEDDWKSLGAASFGVSNIAAFRKLIRSNESFYLSRIPVEL